VSKLSEPGSLLSRLPHGARILIIRLRSLGDIVLETPGLAALHAWRPDLRLYVLVEPAYAAVLEGNPAVAEVLLLRGFSSTVRELRRRRLAAVFNHHAGPTSALLTVLAGSPVRVCWAGCQFSGFYNVLVPVSSGSEGQALHTVEHRLEQFYGTGLPRGPIPMSRIYPQAEAVATGKHQLAEKGLNPQQPYAVIHPAAPRFPKRWPVEKFAAVARWLRERYGLIPVIVLDSNDYELGNAIRERFSPPQVVLDSLSLGQLIAVIAGARLFLGNDSGPAHLAAAAGCPTVVIFGASDAVVWRPWGVACRVVRNDFLCNPCPTTRCAGVDGLHCILTVTAEQVCEACDSLLNEEKASVAEA